LKSFEDVPVDVGHRTDRGPVVDDELTEHRNAPSIAVTVAGRSDTDT
jgi:hypothetical protein